MKEVDALFASFDWAPVAEELVEHGSATVRATMTTDGLRMVVIPYDQLHCPTCQCARIAGVAPQPDNRNSKSWHDTAGGHHNAGTGPAKPPEA